MDGAGERPPTPTADETLREISAGTVRAICELRVAPAQERFVAPNARSIAQAYFERELSWFRAIYADGRAVGFLLLEDDVANEVYFLSAFMIDARYQGMGFGARALALLVEHVRGRPGAAALYTSCVPGDGSPCPFYERFGFMVTGEVDNGALVMRLGLAGGKR